MALWKLWQRAQDGGYEAVAAMAPTDPLDAFYLALIAFNADQFETAARFARIAAERDSAHHVFAQASIYLDRVIQHGKAGVYVDGEAFAAFIRGGGNVHLYAAVSDTLRVVYATYSSLTVLDIGVGDGLALLPALTETVAHVTLVEPSETMLARTTDALRRQGVGFTAINTTIQQFMAQAAADVRWSVIQATWSLQSIPPEERPAIFAWLHAHSDRVLIAEFDVPAFDALLAPPRVQYIVERYARGLAEYENDGGVVAQGFLMPVLFGYFDASAARTNWEGPIQDWVAQLQEAGFTQVETRKLYSYFWADSYVIDAQ